MKSYPRSPRTTDIALARKHARFITRECDDMLMGAGDGAMFILAMQRATDHAWDTQDFGWLAQYALKASQLCSQWLDEWADRNSPLAGYYAGVIAVLDEQDSGLPADGLRLAAATALITFDAARLRELYERFVA